MAIINMMTPGGPAEIEIAGDTITDAELEQLKKIDPNYNPDEGFDYRLMDEDIIDSGMGNAPPPPDQGTPPPEASQQEVRSYREMGEIEDLTFRYNFGRADNVEDQRHFLATTLGAEAIQEPQPGVFMVDQSKVAPEKRAELGLQDSGFVYVDKPGFTWGPDTADFIGEEGPALITGLGTGLAIMGTTAMLPAMAIVGGAVAIVKGVDELIDQIEGYNTESFGEVAENVAWTGTKYGLFEGGGRLAFKGLQKLFKGAGPTVSGEAVDAVIARDPTGKMKTKEAMTKLEKLTTSIGLRLDPEKVAVEEAKAAARELINQGAKPTIGAVSGLERPGQTALAIAEKVVPDPSIGKANTAWITKILRDVRDGKLPKEQAEAMFEAQSKEIAQVVNKTMSDPEQAISYSQRILRDVIGKRLETIQKSYNPREGYPSEFAELLPMVSKMFQAQSSKLYKNAEDLIGEEATTFSMAGIQQAVKDLKGSNAFVQYKGLLFDVIEKTPTMGLQQLQQLKQALSLSYKDPELIASAAQAGISRIIKAVDDTIDAKFIQLSDDLANGTRTVQLDNGNVFKLGWGPLTSDSLRQGLGAWKKAAEYYTKGQEDFNNLAINTIIKTVKDKFWSSNIDVAETVVKAGNAPQLKTYLEAVTPRGESAGELSKKGASGVIENISKLVNQGQLAEANKIIDNFFPEGTVPKVSEFINKLGKDDIFTQIHLKEYGETLEQLRRLALAGGVPMAVREAARNGLAKTWIEQSISKSKDVQGRTDLTQFSQKFFALGEDVQNTLFGKDAASVLRNTLNKTYLLGAGQQDELIKSIPKFTDSPLKDSLLRLKTIVDEANEGGKLAAFKAINSGTIENPQAVITEILNSPNAFNKIRKVIGDAEIDKAGGLRDTAMQMLLSKTTLDATAVQSGTWGREFSKAITEMNKSGGLNAILGADQVKRLMRLADDSVTVSDASFKGLGALVGPTARIARSAALGTAAVSSGLAILTLGYLAGPALAAIGTYASLTLVPKVLSKLFRNKTFLKLISSPSVRSADYDAMIAAGAKLPSRKELKESGKVMYYWNNKLLPIIQETVSQTAASGAVLEPLKEEVRVVTEESYDPSGKVINYATSPKEGLRPLPETPKEVLDIYNPANPTVRGTEVDSLRQTEINKLLGVGP